MNITGKIVLAINLVAVSGLILWVGIFGILENFRYGIFDSIQVTAHTSNGATITFGFPIITFAVCVIIISICQLYYTFEYASKSKETQKPVEKK